MVRKTEKKDIKGDTRILFKKSNNSLCTESRTCSGLSQFYTRSTILLIKKNLSKATEQYTDGDKVKKDFSIETDICILRRYYKNKRLKLASQGGSAKSKYSTVIDTELVEIEEFKPNSNDYSDNKHAICNNKLPKIDLATLMVHNLKGLLNNWFHNNKNVKDSMHCEDLNTADDTNSQTTYILKREEKSYHVKNKKLDTTSIMCQYCKQKPLQLIVYTSKKAAVDRRLSSQSVPFSIKKLRLVSSLNVPRKIHNNRKLNLTGIRKIGRNKFAITISESRKLLKPSTYSLLRVSTKSLTNRCATCDFIEPYRKIKTACYPELKYKNTMNNLHNAINNEINQQITNIGNLKDMPSLFKNICANHPANIKISEKYITKTVSHNFNMTDDPKKNKIKKILKDNSKYKILDSKESFLHNKSNKPKDSSPTLINKNFTNKSHASTKTCLTEYKENFSTTLNVNKRKVKNRCNKYGKRLQKIQNKSFSIYYKKMSNKQLGDERLSKKIQNVLKYFSDYSYNKNIKFDINISFSPPQTKVDKSIDVSCKNFSNSVTSSPTVTHLHHIIDMPENLIENSKESDDNPNDLPVITILPSLEDEVQYKFASNKVSSRLIATLRDNSENKKDLNSSDLELIKEISELKSVIKDLATDAKKIIAERYKKDENLITNKEIPKKSSICNHSSKAVQFSSHFQTLAQYGIKLSKESKIDANEYYNRLMKKSNSYKIIDSESVLKVTDMTVTHEANYDKESEERLSCSLPKSRSLFEMTNGKKSLIATYYCDKCTPKPNFCNNTSACTPCRNNISNGSKCSNSLIKCENNSSPLCLCINSTSSMSKDEKYKNCKDDQLSDQNFQKNNLNRSKAGFELAKGCLYCFLFWIPVIIVLILIYIFVLDDKIRPSPMLTKLREGHRKHLRCKNNDTLELRLSDLGF